MIDSALKRRSAVATRRLPWIVRRFPPAPDGTINQGDRQQLGGVYAGIASDSPTPPPTVTVRMSNIYLYPRGL